MDKIGTDNEYSKKKDGSRRFIQVHWRHPIQKSEKNIRYPYPLEQRYSLSMIIITNKLHPTTYELDAEQSLF